MASLWAEIIEFEGCSEGASLKSERDSGAPSPDVMTKTVLVVRLHSLGHGRMDEDVRKFEVIAEHGLHKVLAKIATSLRIERPVFCPSGDMPHHLHRDVGKVSEYVRSDVPWHVEMYSTRDDPAHDLYQDLLQDKAPIKLREGFGALVFAALCLEVDRFAFHLKSIDAKTDYGALSPSVYQSNLVDILVMLSSGRRPAPQALRMVKLICKKPGMDLGAYPKYGMQTAAQVAAEHGRQSILEALLDAGAPTTGLYDACAKLKEMDPACYTRLLEIVVRHVSLGDARPCSTARWLSDDETKVKVKTEKGVVKQEPGTSPAQSSGKRASESASQEESSESPAAQKRPKREPVSQ
jgi:hypothetical protein